VPDLPQARVAALDGAPVTRPISGEAGEHLRIRRELEVAAREHARELRALGLSYQRVANECGIAVCTAWRWTACVPVMTSREHDGRRAPKSDETKHKMRRSMKRKRLGSGIWSPDALALLRSRFPHVVVARRLGVSPSTVRWHRLHRVGEARP
jgi:hypothetical protein